MEEIFCFILLYFFNPMALSPLADSPVWIAFPLPSWVSTSSHSTMVHWAPVLSQAMGKSPSWTPVGKAGRFRKGENQLQTTSHSQEVSVGYGNQPGDQRASPQAIEPGWIPRREQGLPGGDTGGTVAGGQRGAHTQMKLCTLVFQAHEVHPGEQGGGCWREL